MRHIWHDSLRAEVFHHCKIKYPLIPIQKDQKSIPQACSARKDYLFIFKFAAVIGQHLFTTFLPEQRGGTSELPFKGKRLADSASRDLRRGGVADPASSSSQLSSHTQSKHALFTISFTAKFNYKGLSDPKIKGQDLQVFPKLSNSVDLPTMLISNGHTRISSSHKIGVSALAEVGRMYTKCRTLHTAKCTY